MLDIEHHEQVLVANWLRDRKILFTASTQGMKLPFKVAVKLKAMGYRAGTADLLIFEPRGVYHGLFIEMKRPNIPHLGIKKGKPSLEQIRFLVQAALRGYAAVFCYGSDDAISMISRYLALSSNETLPQGEPQ